MKKNRYSKGSVFSGCIVSCLLLFSQGFAQEAPTLPEGDECIICHLEVGEIPADFSEFDVHLQEGLSCAGCHGGDPTEFDDVLAKAPETGFIGVPERADIPAMCGKCHSDPTFMHEFQPRIHTDQVDQYYTSVHGERLAEVGDEKVATCSNCHTSHGILPASDARSTIYPINLPTTCETCHSDADYMSEYRIRTNQFAEFSESVHGEALLDRQDVGAPACNDCHGNHGAVPPEVASLSDVCGSCHINNERYFLESAMYEPFAEDELHACIECHGYHGVKAPTDEMVGVGDEAICMDCHSEGEDAYVAADSIHLLLTNLVALYDSAGAYQEEVVRIGMDDVEIEYLLREAHQSLIHARTLVHTFEPSRVAERTSEGTETTQAAIDMAQEQIQESKTRRYGFGFATIFITLLAVGLYLKIRELDAKES